MIISGGFKEFNSTLTKTKIRRRSSSRYFRKLPVQSWELATKRRSKVSWNPSQSTAGFKNFGETFVDCLKIIEGKPSDNRSPYFRCSAKTQGSKPYLSTTSMPRHQRLKPASLHHFNDKSQSLKPASQYHCSTKMQRLNRASQRHCKAKTRGSKLAFQHYNSTQARSSRPASNVTPMRKYGVRGPHHLSV